MATSQSPRRRSSNTSLDQASSNQLGNEAEAINRYYLHHHSPTHGYNRPLNIIRRHLSSSGLTQGNKMATNGSISSASQQQHLHQQPYHGFRRSYSNITNTTQLERQRSISSSGILSPPAVEEIQLSRKHVAKGHSLVQATCTKLRLHCETCLHSVHRHHYLYCEHCPVVCHNRTDCITKIPRQCPSEELGIYGWGESRNEIKVVESSVIDFDEVYLSGSLGLQANKCFECGRTLDPSIGHQLATKAPNEAEMAANEGQRHTKFLPSKLSRSVSKEGGIAKQSNGRHDSGEFRVCHMTGKFYCERCHWNDKWYIPGSIFLLNDASKLAVCRSAYLKLRVLWDSIVMKLPAYWHRENRQAVEVFSVRSRLHQLLRHTLVCPAASALKDSIELIEPTHLLGYPSYMRMCDVIEVLNNTLLPRLMEYANTWSEHIKTCEVGDCHSGSTILRQPTMYALVELVADLQAYAVERSSLHW